MEYKIEKRELQDHINYALNEGEMDCGRVRAVKLGDDCLELKGDFHAQDLVYIADVINELGIYNG